MRFALAYLIYTWGVLHRWFGNRHGDVREYAIAARYFTRALRVDDSLRMPRLHRGVLLWRELGRPAEAIGDFATLLARDPDDADALFNRAMALQADGRFVAALADLDAYLAAGGTDNYRDLALRSAQLIREMLAAKE